MNGSYQRGGGNITILQGSECGVALQRVPLTWSGNKQMTKL